MYLTARTRTSRRHLGDQILSAMPSASHPMNHRIDHSPTDLYQINRFLPCLREIELFYSVSVASYSSGIKLLVTDKPYPHPLET